jgi:type IV secretory pathway TraG/TraD family ATPase VirD4
MLVLGPPRSGKTTSLVIPAVLDAPGAVVSTSTKPDVLVATSGLRHLLGNPFVFDPSGTVALRPGSYPARWSPLGAATNSSARWPWRTLWLERLVRARR